MKVLSKRSTPPAQPSASSSTRTSSPKKFLPLLANFVLVALSYQSLRGIAVLAGPAPSIRVTREIYPPDVILEPVEKIEGSQTEVCIVGDVIYGAEEPVPADQPCLRCKCQPPGVQCETTRCVKKPGCRAIHKPNKCCPEYQCECEHEGKFYANGERLETSSGGECRVCYCRGGEVQCADVSCYIRTDCEGTTVTGQCCPRYDHCPPKEPLIDRLTSYTTQSLQQTSAQAPQIEVITTQEDVVNQLSPEIQNASTDEPIVSTLAVSTPQPPLQSSNETVLSESRPDEEPKITIQEIIPEIKEIPITGPPKRDFDPYVVTRQPLYSSDFSVQFEELNKSGLFRDREDNDLNLGDTESDSSEISEVYHHPPPVLKIGDQLLFLKKGELVPGKEDLSTPLPVITIIGAEGLQRGTAEDSSEHEESHIVSYVKGKSEGKSPLETIQDAILQLEMSNSTTQHNTSLDDFLTATERSTDSSNVTNEINETSTSVEGLESFITNFPDENFKNVTTTDDSANNETNKDVSLNKPSHPMINIETILPTSILTETIQSNSNEDVGENENRSIEQIINSGLENLTAEHSTTDRSTETMEDSGENTTPKGGTTGILMDASVELNKEGGGDSGIEKLESGLTIDLDNVQNSTSTSMDKDVEMIDPKVLMAHKEEPITSTTTVISTVTEDESEAIFKNLNDELKTVSPKSLKHHLNEEEESEVIFKELLDDATSTENADRRNDDKTGPWEAGEKESQLIRKVSQAISQFQGKGGQESLDTSVIGILKDFFSSQYKYYTGN